MCTLSIFSVNKGYILQDDCLHLFECSILLFNIYSVPLSIVSAACVVLTGINIWNLSMGLERKFTVVFYTFKKHNAVLSSSY